MSPEELLADPWAFGPWCWHVAEVRLLRDPVKARGMNGLWPLNQSQVDALAELGVRARSGLTLRQPFASAIAIGPKRIENRPRRMTIEPGGTWVGLHAGITDYEDAEGVLRACVQTGRWLGAPALADLPRGMLLGAMLIDGVHRYPVGPALPLPPPTGDSAAARLARLAAPTPPDPPKRVRGPRS
jgi:hypothetical protein